MGDLEFWLQKDRGTGYTNDVKWYNQQWQTLSVYQPPIGTGCETAA